jgi:hypothetical protein
VVEYKPGCSSQTIALPLEGTQGLNLPSDAQELLGQNMRLSYINIHGVGDYMYDIEARVVYGDSSVLTSADSQSPICQGGDSSQFCAVSDLASVVQMRVQ